VVAELPEKGSDPRLEAQWRKGDNYNMMKAMSGIK